MKIEREKAFAEKNLRTINEYIFHCCRNTVYMEE